jgi:uncharacterized membrane protein YeaQ/YmgE (transglycosylase-associated protein family)
MSLEGFIILLVISGICGAIAQSLVGHGRGGCLASVALGFIGAMIGGVLYRKLGLPEPFLVPIGDRPFPILWSIIGASLFVALLALLSGRAAN